MPTARRLRAVFPLILAVLTFFGASAARPTSALACSAPTSSHCYALAWWTPGTTPNIYDGAITFIQPTRLSAYSCSVFMTDEMWLIPGNYVQTFVEAGWLVGHRTNGDSGCDLSYFWAEQPVNNTCGNYSLHTNLPGLVPTLGANTAFKISWNGGYQWGVYISPPTYSNNFVGNSVNCGYGTALTSAQNGIETDNNLSHVTAAHTAMQKRLSGGGWSYSWPGTGAIYRAPTSNNPVTGSWVSQDLSANFSAN